MSIKIAPDFFNNVVSELDRKYFPEVKYYRDNKKTTKIHYTTELFNNGCITYNKFVETLSKACSDTQLNIHIIVRKNIDSFGDFQYMPK